MLGIGRASQYAGWWNTGLSAVEFSSASEITSLQRRPTGYSMATRDVNSGQIQNGGVRFLPGSPASGTIDISGVPSLTSYNIYRTTAIAHVNLDSATYTTYTGYGTPGSTWRQVYINSSGVDRNVDFQLQVNLDNFSVSFMNNGYGLGSAVPYYDRWLTNIASTAETSSAFADWTGGDSSGSNIVALRLSTWDTLTATLIYKQDMWIDTSRFPGNWSTDYATTLDVEQVYSANKCFFNCYGAGGDELEGNPLTRYGGLWASWGTMFDPLTVTDNSWLTAAPANQYGDAVAWYNSQFTGYNAVNTSSMYNTSPAGVTGLYSQPNNVDWVVSVNVGGHLDEMYSDTILVRNI